MRLDNVWSVCLHAVWLHLNKLSSCEHWAATAESKIQQQKQRWKYLFNSMVYLRCFTGTFQSCFHVFVCLFYIDTHILLQSTCVLIIIHTCMEFLDCLTTKLRTTHMWMLSKPAARLFVNEVYANEWTNGPTNECTPCASLEKIDVRSAFIKTIIFYC